MTLVVNVGFQQLEYDLTLQGAFVTYVVVGLITVLAFLLFVVFDRRQNGTPWNHFTISTRIPMLLVLWPLFHLAFLASFIGERFFDSLKRNAKNRN